MAANHFSQAGSEPPAPMDMGGSKPSVKRKRITQRLVLGGKSGAVPEGEGGKIKLPGAQKPVMENPQLDHVQGDIEIPVYVLLQNTPAEFLMADHETLFASEVAQAIVLIPLRLILPGLPSGKIEIPAQSITECMPDGVMLSQAELGEYASSPITLPLYEVIPRIPEEFLALRYDQKPIDSSVSGLDDPFSLEALQAAAAEAEAEMADPAALSEYEGSEGTDSDAIVDQQPEAYASEAEPEEIPTLPMPPQELLEDLPEEPLPSESSSELESAEEFQSESLEEELTLPEGIAPEVEDEADLSFTKTEAFKQFLEENVDEEDGIDAELAVTELLEDLPDQSAEAEADEAQTETIKLPASERPPFSPEEDASALMPKAPRLPKLSPSVPSKGNAEATPSFSFKAPPKTSLPGTPPTPQPKVETVKPAFKGNPKVSKTSKMSSPAAHAVVQISSELKRALRLGEDQDATLRDIVHQMNCWPGMDGCILGGKDGLTITSEIEDERFGNSLSAFAPKILGRLNELFQDLGFESVEEIQTPMNEGCIFIYRHDALFLVAISSESNLPVSYRGLIKQVVMELAEQNTKTL